MSDEGQKLFCPSHKKTLLGHSVGMPIDLSTPDVFCLSSTRHRKVVQSPQSTESGGGGGVVVKPNTAGGSGCRHRKVVQNPHFVQADTHDYFLRRPKAGWLHPSSKSGPESPLYIITLWLVALRLDGVVFQKVAPEPPPCILLYALIWTGGMPLTDEIRFVRN